MSPHCRSFLLQVLVDASEPRTQAVALRTLHSLLTALDSPPPAAQCAAWSNLVLQAMQGAADAVSESEPPPKDILSVQVIIIALVYFQKCCTIRSNWDSATYQPSFYDHLHRQYTPTSSSKAVAIYGVRPPPPPPPQSPRSLTHFRYTVSLLSASYSDWSSTRLPQTAPPTQQCRSLLRPPSSSS